MRAHVEIISRKAALLLLLLLSFSQPSHAIRQYRCAGRIQYHPCTMVFPGMKRNSPSGTQKNTVPARSAPRPPPSEPYVEIVGTSFSQVNAHRGVWQGRLRGNGVIAPQLQIFRGAELESSRPMGAVVLMEQETPFTFNSALPSGADWSWRIVAQAR